MLGVAGGLGSRAVPRWSPAIYPVVCLGVAGTAESSAVNTLVARFGARGGRIWGLLVAMADPVGAVRLRGRGAAAAAAL